MTCDPALLRRRKRTDVMFRALCFGAAGVGVLLLGIFLVKIFVDGAPRVNFDFIKGELSRRPAKTGIWPAIIGSLFVMILTMLIAVPLGVAAAIFLEEFNTRKNRLTDFIQLNIANLSGVPSIVYGLLGLAVFVRMFALKQSIWSGALTMSLLILPMVIIVTQEALKAVPKSYREGSLALGSTRWQAIRLQALPAAGPGIMTGVILAMSRAIGETAPLIVVGAASFVTGLPSLNRDDRYTVLPIQIFDWASDSKAEFNKAAAGAILVLMVALLLLNSIAIYIRGRKKT